MRFGWLGNAVVIAIGQEGISGNWTEVGQIANDVIMDGWIGSSDISRIVAGGSCWGLRYGWLGANTGNGIPTGTRLACCNLCPYSICSTAKASRQPRLRPMRFIDDEMLDCSQTTEDILGYIRQKNMKVKAKAKWE
ncbi:hypothetical protein PV325_003457 [Microctonus aethiopoides]|nr:hypothetical protein PV325_003457 [Microctonus aethiopoides]